MQANLIARSAYIFLLTQDHFYNNHDQQKWSTSNITDSRFKSAIGIDDYPESHVFTLAHIKSSYSKKFGLEWYLNNFDIASLLPAQQTVFQQLLDVNSFLTALNLGIFKYGKQQHVNHKHDQYKNHILIKGLIKMIADLATQNLPVKLDNTSKEHMSDILTSFKNDPTFMKVINLTPNNIDFNVLPNE